MPYEDFVDLCAISNISLIIFDEALHGYYIHGMNPFGQAEGSLQYIESVFEKESRCKINLIQHSVRAEPSAMTTPTRCRLSRWCSPSKSGSPSK